jgi:hypothetical protein
MKYKKRTCLLNFEYFSENLMQSIFKTKKIALAQRSLFMLGLSLMTFGTNELSVLAQNQQLTNTSIIIASIPGVVIDIGGKGYQNFYDNNGSRVRTNLEFPEHDQLSGSAIMGKQDVEKIGNNQWFSVISLQDGFVRLAILQKGKKLNINYFGKHYQFQQLIKVGNRRYILNSQHDPNEGGDDYYDVDLRNINKPRIRKIDLATAQRLGRTNSNQKLSNSNSRAKNQCQSAINQARATITKGRQIQVNIQTFSFGKRYKTYPPEYSIGYAIRLSGVATKSVMNSTQFMNIISKRIINNCKSVGLVDFVQDQSDWVIRFGSINGEVQRFKCVEHPDKLDWGLYFCV